MFYDSQDKIDDAASELCLMRTILERLECSFASQEAKLDKLLGMMSKLPQPKFSSPDATVSHAMSITPTAVATSLHNYANCDHQKPQSAQTEQCQMGTSYWIPSCIKRKMSSQVSNALSLRLVYHFSIQILIIRYRLKLPMELLACYSNFSKLIGLE